MADFTRTQSSSLEQSTASLYNEAVKFRKAGLKEEAEDKFRAALKRNKKHLPSLLGLGSLLRERGETEGMALLHEASGIVSSPVDEGPAARARSGGQRLHKSSFLASFTFRRPPSAEKLVSIKDAGNAVRQHMHRLKMFELKGPQVEMLNAKRPNQLKLALQTMQTDEARMSPFVEQGAHFDRCSSAPAEIGVRHTFMAGTTQVVP